MTEELPAASDAITEDASAPPASTTPDRRWWQSLNVAVALIAITALGLGIANSISHDSSYGSSLSAAATSFYGDDYQSDDPCVNDPFGADCTNLNDPGYDDSCYGSYPDPSCYDSNTPGYDPAPDSSYGDLAVVTTTFDRQNDDVVCSLTINPDGTATVRTPYSMEFFTSTEVKKLTPGRSYMLETKQMFTGPDAVTLGPDGTPSDYTSEEDILASAKPTPVLATDDELAACGM